MIVFRSDTVRNRDARERGCRQVVNIVSNLSEELQVACDVLLNDEDVVTCTGENREVVIRSWELESIVAITRLEFDDAVCKNTTAVDVDSKATIKLPYSVAGNV